jgi:hypothetical protein
MDTLFLAMWSQGGAIQGDRQAKRCGRTFGVQSLRVRRLTLWSVSQSFRSTLLPTEVLLSHLICCYMDYTSEDFRLIFLATMA